MKARLRDPENVVRRLEEHGTSRDDVYEDRYYDTLSADLAREDRELRLRTIHGQNGTESILTYKDARLDEASGSKPEHETGVDNPEAVHAMLERLGFTISVEFEKRCKNFKFPAVGREMKATIVTVPDIGNVFLELETLVADEVQLHAALDDVRNVLSELGVEESELTNELYTEAVIAARRRNPTDC